MPERQHARQEAHQVVHLVHERPADPADANPGVAVAVIVCIAAVNIVRASVSSSSVRREGIREHNRSLYRVRRDK